MIDICLFDSTLLSNITMAHSWCCHWYRCLQHQPVALEMRRRGETYQENSFMWPNHRIVNENINISSKIIVSFCQISEKPCKCEKYIRKKHREYIKKNIITNTQKQATGSNDISTASDKGKASLWVVPCSRNLQAPNCAKLRRYD